MKWHQKIWYKFHEWRADLHWKFVTRQLGREPTSAEWDDYCNALWGKGN